MLWSWRWACIAVLLPTPLAQVSDRYLKPDTLGFEVVLHDTKGDWLDEAVSRLTATGVGVEQAEAVLSTVRKEKKRVIARCPLETCVKLQKSFLEIGMKAEVREQTEFPTYAEQQAWYICSHKVCWEGVLKTRADRQRIVTLAVVNKAFVPFWYNLKCTLKYAKINNDIVIGTDYDACADAVLMQGTYCMNGNALFFEERLHSGSHGKGSVEFASIVRSKTSPVLSALELGYSVLFTDVDVVWIADPRPWLLIKARLDSMLEPMQPKMKRRKKKKTSNKKTNPGYLYEEPGELVKLDALFQSDYEPSNEAPCNSYRDCKLSFRCMKAKHEAGHCAPEASSGFYLLRAGESTRKFIRRVQELIALQVDDISTEQWAFNAALGEMGKDTGDMRWELLPMHIFPNGWYFFNHTKSFEKKPLIVHNNGVNGGNAKERRFRDSGLWVVGGSREQPSCKSQDPNEGKPPGWSENEKSDKPKVPTITFSKEDLKKGHKKIYKHELFHSGASATIENKHEL